MLTTQPLLKAFFALFGQWFALQDPFWKFCADKWEHLPKDSQGVGFYDALACDCADGYLTALPKTDRKCPA